MTDAPDLEHAAVDAFALIMKRKLDENAHKGRCGWRAASGINLLNMLDREMFELRSEINQSIVYHWRPATSVLDARGRLTRTGVGGRAEVADPSDFHLEATPALRERIARECADVANFAMMIADVFGGLEAGR